MLQFKISAPGKVILYGEHAVVYGKTALAASVDLRTKLEFKELPVSEKVIKLSFPKVYLTTTVSLEDIHKHVFNTTISKSTKDHDILYDHIHKFVQTIGYANMQQKLTLEAFFYVFILMSCEEQIKVKPFQIELTTELSISSGLGSSASFAVCLSACFLHWSHLQKDMAHSSFSSEDLDTISKYALRCEKIIHGTPSGIDNSVCTYGSIIEFKMNQYIKPIFGAMGMKILLVDTRVNRSTKALVQRLADLKRNYPAIINLILDAMDNISQQALSIIKEHSRMTEENTKDLSNDDYKQLMTLINMNQGLLATCQVSHPSLDRICAEAQNYGLAAKLTGAGGGGCAYVLLFPDTEPEVISSISRKLIADGYSVLLTTLGCKGVEICE